MSDPTPHDPAPETKTHDERKRDERLRDARANDTQGNGVKWLAGAAVAALVLGGGYYALKNMPQGQPVTEVASVDSGYGAPPPSSFAPVTGPGSATTDGATTTVASSTETTTTATTTRRRAAARATPEDVPEMVVGVSPASATADDATAGNSDEIIVTAGRRPVWASTPSARRLSALYPARALERGREGEASVHCMVLDTGALDCVRASETPLNSGFGNAALRVASKFRHAPQRADGSTAAGTPVNLRVVFRIEDNERRRG